MCACGQFDGDGVFLFTHRGHFHMHQRTGCIHRDATTWRTRIFSPVAAFFDRLAGDYKCEAWHEIEEEKRRAHVESARRLRRGSIRAAITQDTQEN